MAETVTSELIYEILKEIRDDVRHIRARVDGHDDQFKSIRHMLVAMQSDDLRHEATVAGLRVDIDSIRRRLNLADPAN